jgi:hypothetical protein
MFAPQADYDESARTLAESASFLPLGKDPTLDIDVQVLWGFWCMCSHGILGDQV